MFENLSTQILQEFVESAGQRVPVFDLPHVNAGHFCEFRTSDLAQTFMDADEKTREEMRKIPLPKKEADPVCRPVFCEICQIRLASYSSHKIRYKNKKFCGQKCGDRASYLAWKAKTALNKPV